MKEKINIAIVDAHTLNPGDLSWKPLEEFGTLHIYDNTTPQETIERTKDSEIVITNKVCFNSDTFDKLPKLKCIVVTATGYNNIDIAAAQKHGIVVCNAPNYSTPSVTQHVFALLLHLTNHIDKYTTDCTDGKWAASQHFCYLKHQTTELTGKTMGIVGLGNIGLNVANVAHSFGMNIIAETSKKSHDLPDYITAVSRSELFSQSDVISLHAPLTPQTHLLVNDTTLSLVKPNTIIINTARGGMVDEHAVAKALKEQKLAAYAADVLSTEPPSPDNPLLNAPNSFITPHIAWATQEARQRLMDITIDNVKAFLSNNPINKVS